LSVVMISFLADFLKAMWSSVAFRYKYRELGKKTSSESTSSEDR